MRWFSWDCAGGISYVNLILKMVHMFIKTSFFPPSLAARLEAGAIWSMTHRESRKGDLGHKTSIDQARQKHNCVKLQKNKQFSHRISRAVVLMDILTSYRPSVFIFLVDFPIICFRLSWFTKIIIFPRLRTTQELPMLTYKIFF